MKQLLYAAILVILSTSALAISSSGVETDFVPNAVNETLEEMASENKTESGNETAEAENTPAEDTEEKAASLPAKSSAPKITAQAVSEPAERKPLPEMNEPEHRKNNNDGQTYWFLVAVGLLAAGTIFFLVRSWINSRKGFGF